MLNRKLKLLGLVIVGLIVILGIVYIGMFRTEERVALQKTKIGIQNNPITALVIMASKLGYFEEEGLNIEIVKYPSGKLALQGMLNGEVDFSTAADMPVMVNSFKRDDFRVICSIANTSSGAWIIARKDAGISGPRDLIGKRIATQKNSAVHYFLHAFLLNNRIAEKDVEIVFMRPGELASSLHGGSIDAFSMRNPFIVEAKGLLGENAVELIAPDAYLQMFNLLGMAEYIEVHPDIVEGIVRAILKAERFMDEGAGEHLALLVEYFGDDKKGSLEEDMRRYRFSVDLDQALLLTLDNEAEWAIEEGIVDGSSIPNYFEFIYFEALEKLKPEGISIIR